MKFEAKNYRSLERFVNELSIESIDSVEISTKEQQALDVMDGIARMLEHLEKMQKHLSDHVSKLDLLLGYFYRANPQITKDKIPTILGDLVLDLELLRQNEQDQRLTLRHTLGAFRKIIEDME